MGQGTSLGKEDEGFYMHTHWASREYLAFYVLESRA